MWYKIFQLLWITLPPKGLWMLTKVSIMISDHFYTLVLGL